ncbi:MAG: (2Fe-2S) ferredoxin domain-containing protein [bacterium]
MEHIKRHVFVCINQRPANHPMGCCQSKGSIEVIQALNEAVGMSDLAANTAVAGATCLGPCTMGPTIVVYPEGVWYAGVKSEDVAELVEEHLRKGNPVERLRLRMPAPPGAEGD